MSLGSALRRLRHPWLFALAAVALVADLAVPDFIPFVDEILLVAATTGLGLLKKRRSDKTTPEAEAPEDHEEPTA